MHNPCRAVLRHRTCGRLCLDQHNHSIESYQRFGIERLVARILASPKRSYSNQLYSRLESQHNDSHQINIVQIQNGTFYREHPSSRSRATGNEVYFANLTFSIRAKSTNTINQEPQTWAVIGTKNSAKLLEVIRGSYFCDPPTARSYPYLSSEEIKNKNPDFQIPSRAIQYVGFNSKSALGSGIQGAYLSARYESHREETDWTVLQYLQGDTELNPSQELSRTLKEDDKLLQQVVKDLRLQKLVSMPVSNLSNGQTRRARIAKALLSRPELLLLDEPFMGLDPPTLMTLSPMLQNLAYGSGPLLVLALRPQDPIPAWITHVIILDEHGTIALSGPKADQFHKMSGWADGENKSEWRRELIQKHGKPPAGTGTILTETGIHRWTDFTTNVTNGADQNTQVENSTAKSSSQPAGNSGSMSKSIADVSQQKGEPLIEVQDLTLKYGTKTILGHTAPGLNLLISRGTRLALLGPNGSGKTTLLSLFTSDHPQSYSLPVKFFGRDRLPTKGQPGLSLWEIQARIGHSSPEVHAFFPKHLSVRRVLESAWAETFGSKPKLNDERTRRVNRVLKWWQPELQIRTRLSTNMTKHSLDDDVSWAEDRTSHAFRDLSFEAQRLLLLLRALIKEPDILVLDEAFSGLSSEVRDKAMLFLEHGEEYVIEDGRQVQNSRQEDGMILGLSDHQAMVVVSHIREEIPRSVNEWLRLPSEEEATEDGRDVMSGKVEGDGIRSLQGWNNVWGM